MVKKTLLLIVLFLLFRGTSTEGNMLELNSVMMRNTYKIEGKNSVGTCFLIGKPLKKDPKRAHYVLVTAAHILEEMKGAEAIVYLRKRNDDNSFTKIPWKIKIREDDKALWIKNASGLDVAVMYIAVPADIDVELLPTVALADDKVLNDYEIHPGDELYCLGFPFTAEANEEGFPILRSGRIASFPLVPTQKYKTFLLDFQVYKGNSGGPVYFIDSNRYYGGTPHLGKIQLIVGIVSGEHNLIETIKSLDEIKQKVHSLGLAVVIHATHILETINQLPEMEDDNIK